MKYFFKSLILSGLVLMPLGMPYFVKAGGCFDQRIETSFKVLMGIGSAGIGMLLGGGGYLLGKRISGNPAAGSARKVAMGSTITGGIVTIGFLGIVSYFVQNFRLSK